MARATRIALDLALAASKSLRPGAAIAWHYAKVEMIPPNTQCFFNGPAGKKLENTVSKFADDFIAGLEGRIREIEAEKERQIKAKEAAIKAAHDRAIAEAKRKEEQKLKKEAFKKELVAKQAKEKAEKEKKVEAAKSAATAAAKPAATAASKPAAKPDAKTEKPKENNK